MNIKRGDVLLVDFEPVKGSEQGKTRPCVVIQNDLGNASSLTTIVAPLTSRTENAYPFTVLIKNREGGLSKDSLVLLNQIRTISIQARVLKKLGSLKSETMKKVDEAIKTSLGLD